MKRILWIITLACCTLFDATAQDTSQLLRDVAVACTSGSHEPPHEGGIIRVFKVY